MVLPIILGIFATLALLPTLIEEEEPVARVSPPELGPQLEAPEARQRARSQAEPEAADARLGERQSEDESLPREVELSRKEKGPLRSDLVRVAEAYPARYGVVVLDPSTGQTVRMDADQRFLAASLGKLPVFMALYRLAASGQIDLDDEITMQASDVQAYGTGVLQTYPVGYTLTLRECATLLIKESDNTAWKMLNRYVGTEYVRAELYRVGAVSTEYWIPNTTTANDVLLMLEKISDPSYTSPALSAEMLDIMTNTSFEDWMPQPLPEELQVSHKIGLYGSTFGDAGLVFPKGSHDARDAYFIVLIASETSEFAARDAMREMSMVTYESLSSADSASGGRKSGS